MYLRLAASIKGNKVNMLNILRSDGLCKNVHGYYSYYRPVGVTAFTIGAASVDVPHSPTLPLPVTAKE